MTNTHECRKHQCTEWKGYIGFVAPNIIPTGQPVLQGSCILCAKTQVHNAAEAAEMAYNNARTMTTGAFGYSELMQLGQAHECKEDKENVLLRNIAKLGVCAAD